jgi:hypothetical protein
MQWLLYFLGLFKTSFFKNIFVITYILSVSVFSWVSHSFSWKGEKPPCFGPRFKQFQSNSYRHFPCLLSVPVLSLILRFALTLVKNLYCQTEHRKVGLQLFKDSLRGHTCGLLLSKHKKSQNQTFYLFQHTCITTLLVYFTRIELCLNFLCINSVWRRRK